MDRLIHIFLGIKPAPWTQGGSWRLEWLALPQHDRMLMMLVGIGVAVWGVLYLYRREGRNLNLPTRIGLSALRMIVLLGVVVMLLEPVMVFSKQEMEPSNLLVLEDRSESMGCACDAYTIRGALREAGLAGVESEQRRSGVAGYAAIEVGGAGVGWGIEGTTFGGWGSRGEAAGVYFGIVGRRW